MTEDPAEPLRRTGALGELAREDLELLGIGELQARIVALRGEIDRCQAQITRKHAGLSAAEALFKS